MTKAPQYRAIASAILLSSGVKPEAIAAAVMQWVEVGQLRGMARAPLIAGDRIPARTAARAELIGIDRDILREGCGQSRGRAAADPLLDGASAQISVICAHGGDLISDGGWVRRVRRPGIQLQNCVGMRAEVLLDKVVILRLGPVDQRQEERAKFVTRRFI